ncbi:TVP38/TMEM64 family membrane protein [Chlorella vulgaris]
MLKPAVVCRAAKLSLISTRGGLIQPALQPRRHHRRSSVRAPTAAAAKPPNEHHTPGVFLGLPEEALGSSFLASMRGGNVPASAASVAAPVLAAAAVLLCLPAPAEALSVQGAVGGLEDLIQSAGILGPVIFIVAYIAATVVLIPASVLTLAAGFLFGPVLGTVVVSVASTAGAAAAFLVGRYLARPAVEKRMQGNPKFAAVDGAIAQQGAKIVLLLRLSPLFPFTLLNYGLSLTRIEFGPYVAASWAGMLPGTIAYVALGGAGKAAAETAAGGSVAPLQLVLYGLGAAATLWATALISKAASKALDEASAAGSADKPLSGGSCLRPAASSSTRRLAAAAAAGGEQATAAAAGQAMSAAHAAGSADWYRHGMTSLSQGVTMAETLRRLGPEVELAEMQGSAFVKPQSILYQLDGKPRRWDMVLSHPSVAVLLYHRQRKTVILVRQFRPAVYISATREAEVAGQPKPPLSAGFTYELCAGIIDKPGLDLKQITKEEISEECGFDVPLGSIHLVTSYLSAIGISGSRQTIFAAEVDDAMAAAAGGGGLRDHGEAIEVLALPLPQVEEFLRDEELGKSAGLLFALMWLKQQLAANGGQLFPSQA